MKKILIAEDEVDILEIYAMCVEADLSIPVIAVKSGNEAIKELKKDTNHEIAIVISDFNMQGGNGDIVYSYIRENKLDIPFVLVTASPEVLEQVGAFKNFADDDGRNCFIPKPCSVEEVVTVSRSILAKAAPSSGEYAMISAHRLLRYNVLPIDVSLKLHDMKYVKIINKSEMYNAEIINKYLSKGTDFFYVAKSDFKIFVEYHISEMKKLMVVANLPDNEKVELQIETSASINDYVRIFGLDHTMVEAVNHIASTAIILAKSNPNLFALLKKMLHSNAEYVSTHSILIAYVACEISRRLGWCTDSTYQKFTLAALLHDIVLTADLAKVHTKNELLAVKSSHDLSEIKTHPYKTAEMLRELKNMPPDIDSIIFSHHERPDGSGFPRALAANQISALACIFILAEDFVNRGFERGPKAMDKAAEIKYFSETYGEGNFKKQLEALVSFLS